MATIGSNAMKPRRRGRGRALGRGHRWRRDLHALGGINGKRAGCGRCCTVGSAGASRRGGLTLTPAPRATASPAATSERRRPHQHGLVFRAEDRVQLLPVVHKLHRRAAVRVSHEVGKDVVDQRVFLRAESPSDRCRRSSRSVESRRSGAVAGFQSSASSRLPRRSSRCGCRRAARKSGDSRSTTGIGSLLRLSSRVRTSSTPSATR